MKITDHNNRLGVIIKEHIVTNYKMVGQHKIKKWVAILLLFFLTGANSCKPKIKCDCTTKTVCISLSNSSGQPLETLKLLNHGIVETNIGQVALNDKACLSFNSTGENTFSLVANLQNGKTIKSSEVYCEGGYKFIAIATESEIKIDFTNSY